ncbi:hypothetical protein C8R44DRAFT_888740 [Mycena epipterygia]|nr:hypothetical protein C8R44DRAFT_888740 [Mycena epipterygia]
MSYILPLAYRLNPSREALCGFDHLFANQIGAVRTAFQADSTPFHLLDLGICAFLEAALGMESGLMGEAARLLTLSEAGARKAAADAKKAKTGAVGKGVQTGRATAGLELGSSTRCGRVGWPGRGNPSASSS